MNVLIITYDYSRKSLASSFRARNIAKCYKEESYKVNVIAANHDNQEECIEIDGSFIENRNFLQKIYLRMVYYPDPVAYWANKVINYFKKNPHLILDADKIIITSPPHSIQTIALWVKRVYPCKQVISDFRDAFTTNHRIKWYTPVHFIYAQYIERKIFENVDKIIANTPSLAKGLALMYPRNKEKIKFIPNGYVERIKYSSRKGNNKKTIGYFGDGYGDQVQLLIKNIISNDINHELNFLTAGKGNWDLNESYENVWRHLNILTQEQVKCHIANSDILLLIMPNGEHSPSPTIPLKVYEYLSSNKPIIYFGPKGDCWDLLAKYKGTSCFLKSQVDKFVEILKNIEIESVDREDFLIKYRFDRIAKCIIGLEEFK